MEEAISCILGHFNSIELAEITLHHCECDFAENLIFEDINSRLEAVI